MRVYARLRQRNDRPSKGTSLASGYEARAACRLRTILGYATTRPRHESSIRYQLPTLRLPHKRTAEVNCEAEKCRRPRKGG
jgi:hypothetical protein